MQYSFTHTRDALKLKLIANVVSSITVLMDEWHCIEWQQTPGKPGTGSNEMPP